jgi:hypothetical protein
MMILQSREKIYYFYLFISFCTSTYEHKVTVDVTVYRFKLES